MAKTWTQFRHDGGPALSQACRDTSAWCFHTSPAPGVGSRRECEEPASRTKGASRFGTMSTSPRKLGIEPLDSTPGPATYHNLTPRDILSDAKKGAFSKQPRVTGAVQGINYMNLKGGSSAPYYLKHKDWAQVPGLKAATFSLAPRNTSEFCDNSATKGVCHPAPDDYWDSMKIHIEKSKTSRMGFMGTTPRDTAYYLRATVEPTPGPGDYQTTIAEKEKGPIMPRSIRDTSPGGPVMRHSSPGPGTYSPMSPADHAKLRVSQRSSMRSSISSRCSDIESRGAGSKRLSGFRPPARISSGSSRPLSARLSTRLEALAKPRYSVRGPQERRLTSPIPRELPPRHRILPQALANRIIRRTAPPAQYQGKGLLTEVSARLPETCLDSSKRVRADAETPNPQASGLSSPLISPTGSIRMV